ncbi:Retinoblastoma-binding protein [Coemansia sp. BCRC 34301]|nr:Retinoblastoma-binding protein [Coemansia sp. BCRC 34301]
MSHIQYKFRSSKDYSTTIFDGLSISVADLKQDILRDQKLDPEGYNLVITNEQTNEDYANDLTLIPKNTTVLVRRVPYTGPRMPRTMNGGGGAGYHNQNRATAGYTAPPFANGGSHASGYTGYHRSYGAQSNAPANQYGYRGPQGGGINMHRNNTPDHSTEASASFDSGVASSAEDAGIEAMLEQSNEQWMHQQSLMEMQRPVYHGRPGAFRPRPHQMRPENQGPPPPHYICHLCGKPGHWIYSCSLIGQPGEGTGKVTGHRVKRTTGIPKSFLQKVDNIEDVGNALVTSDGTLVVAAANEAAWNRAQKMSRNVIATDELIDPSIIPDAIKCNICRRIARDAVTAPCCKTVFCSACIEHELLEPGPMHFTCPACHAKDVVPDQLETAGETRSKVDEFLREYSLKQQMAEEESERAAKEAAAAAAAAASATGSGTGNVNGTSASSDSLNVAAPSSVSTSVARPPSAQVQAQARPPNRQQQFGMLPGMLMGMGGGFPGMGGMLGQMQGFMPPGMMMMPPPGMMPPPHPGMAAGQWAGNGMAPPVSATTEVVPATSAQHSLGPASDMQSVRAHSRSRSRSKHRRSRSRSCSEHRSSRRRSPRPLHGVRSKSRLSSVDNRDDERRDANGDAAYEAPPMDNVRHVGEHRGQSRDDSRAHRDRRHADDASSGRRGRYRSREREYEREQRRVRDRDGASQREHKKGASRSGSSSWRDERSRSPMHTRESRDGSRRNGSSSEHDPGVRHLSIRGQSAVTVDRSEGGKIPNILDRIRDDRKMPYDGNEQRSAGGGGRRQGGGSGGRRRR